MKDELELSYALGFFERLRGLLFRTLSFNQGLVICPCKSIHTIGMRYCIDVYYFNRHHRCIKYVLGMKACRISRCKGAYYVLELRHGHGYCLEEIEKQCQKHNF